LKDPFATSLRIRFLMQTDVQIGGRRMQIADEEATPYETNPPFNGHGFR
jgi:hypothetical protein